MGMVLKFLGFKKLWCIEKYDLMNTSFLFNSKRIKIVVQENQIFCINCVFGALHQEFGERCFSMIDMGDD